MSVGKRDEKKRAAENAALMSMKLAGMYLSLLESHLRMVQAFSSEYASVSKEFTEARRKIEEEIKKIRSNIKTLENEVSRSFSITEKRHTAGDGKTWEKLKKGTI